VADGPLYLNGVALPPLQPADLADSIVGFGTFNVEWGGRFPGRYRLAVLEGLSRVSSKLRMHGSTGIDMAFVGAGILGAAVSFGGHIWDHAAGVALVRAAGGTVTDLDGGRWTVDTRSTLTAAPGAHAQVLEILRGVGPTEEFR
jgi:myo-inositol-1(or 4)-monophosphatase